MCTEVSLALFDSLAGHSEPPDLVSGVEDKRLLSLENKEGPGGSQILFQVNLVPASALP